MFNNIFTLLHYVFGIHWVNACVKLDPGAYVFMHSGLPLNPGVTKWYQSRVDCRTLAQLENGRS
jgi:hypothetical protein